MGDTINEDLFQTKDPHNGIKSQNAVNLGKEKGTSNDEKDMDRMGKIQQLGVCSNKLSDDVFICSQDTSEDLNSCRSLASLLCLAALGNTH
jgi:hypothetical protein